MDMKIIDNIRKKFSRTAADEGLRLIRLPEVDSTNSYLRNYTPAEGERITVVTADFQTAGRGQGTNSWESEQGKNLLFSVMVHPTMLPVRRQFLLSEAYALALKEALDDYTQDISIKWPNDIYWRDKKISGTLIETRLTKQGLSSAILGTGIDVNQKVFRSDAPNPVSLFNILGREVDRDELLRVIIDKVKKYYAMIENGEYIDIAALYHSRLYRNHGFHPYRDKDGDFEGAIVEVEDDGHLILRDREGHVRSYAFKEVEYIV